MEFSEFSFEIAVENGSGDRYGFLITMVVSRHDGFGYYSFHSGIPCLRIS